MAETPKSLSLEFQVPATATIRVVGASAVEAWAVIEGEFGRSSSALLEGARDGLELVDLHLLGPATLATIDGENPVAELEAALAAHRRGVDRTS